LAEQGFDALSAQLGEGVPDGLRRLDDAQLHDLAAAVADARRRHGAAIAAAVEGALGHIPRLLRGPVRRIVR
jgi:hypothetical protein